MDSNQPTNTEAIITNQLNQAHTTQQSVKLDTKAKPIISSCCLPNWPDQVGHQQESATEEAERNKLHKRPLAVEDGGTTP